MKLDNILNRFGVSSKKLLLILDLHRSVISGSIAVEFALPTASLFSRDIDIYSPRSHGNNIRALLMEQFGLVDVTRPRNPDYPPVPFLHEMYTLCNKHSRFHLMVSDDDNPLEPIAHFHSSVVINYISSSEAYYAYPDLTFNMRNIINSFSYIRVSRDTGNTDRAIDKYVRRGFATGAELHDWPEFTGHECGVHPSCPKTSRSFRDGFGYRLSLQDRAVHSFDSSERIEGESEIRWRLFPRV
ncbi:hypothetical protein H0H93_007053 [Arthromyces matolae]|nr:hypothetical protein H0H93_007053 [Arthromyces matolae]